MVIGSRQLGEHEWRLKGFCRHGQRCCIGASFPALQGRISYQSDPRRPVFWKVEGYDIDSIA